jgi:hypothetical protein
MPKHGNAPSIMNIMLLNKGFLFRNMSTRSAAPVKGAEKYLIVPRMPKNAPEIKAGSGWRVSLKRLYASVKYNNPSCAL